MALGFEGWLKLDGETCLATQGTITVLHDLIESGGAYGGKWSGSQMATGAPHIYDPWKTSSNASFDMTSGAASALAKRLNSRDETYNLTMKMGQSGDSITIKQYWTDINFSSSVGSLTTGGINGIIFKKHDLAGVNLTPPNARGNEYGRCDGLIPYWMTKISLGDCVQDWSVGINQSLSPIYCCNAENISYKVHRDPDYIVFGPVIINLNVTIAAGTVSEKENLTVTIGSTQLNFGRVELQEASDNLATGESLSTVQATYRAYRYG